MQLLTWILDLDLDLNVEDLASSLPASACNMSLTTYNKFICPIIAEVNFATKSHP